VTHLRSITSPSPRDHVISSGNPARAGFPDDNEDSGASRAGARSPRPGPRAAGLPLERGVGWVLVMSAATLMLSAGLARGVPWSPERPLVLLRCRAGAGRGRGGRAGTSWPGRSGA